MSFCAEILLLLRGDFINFSVSNLLVLIVLLGPSPSSDRLSPLGMLHFRHHGLLKALGTLFLKNGYDILPRNVVASYQTNWVALQKGNLFFDSSRSSKSRCQQVCLPAGGSGEGSFFVSSGF